MGNVGCQLVPFVPGGTNIYNSGSVEILKKITYVGCPAGTQHILHFTEYSVNIGCPKMPTYPVEILFFTEYSGKCWLPEGTNICP